MTAATAEAAPAAAPLLADPLIGPTWLLCQWSAPPVNLTNGVIRAYVLTITRLPGQYFADPAVNATFQLVLSGYHSSSFTVAHHLKEIRRSKTSLALKVASIIALLLPP